MEYFSDEPDSSDSEQETANETQETSNDMKMWYNRACITRALNAIGCKYKFDYYDGGCIIVEFQNKSFFMYSENQCLRIKTVHRSEPNRMEYIDTDDPAAQALWEAVNDINRRTSCKVVMRYYAGKIIIYISNIVCLLPDSLYPDSLYNDMYLRSCLNSIIDAGEQLDRTFRLLRLRQQSMN